MKYEIIKEKITSEGFLKIKKGLVKYDSFKSSDKIEKEWESLERGDSVAILIKEMDTNSFLFTNQFRYPTTAHNKGWIIELVAGGIKKDENIKECAIREIEEEIGYQTNKLLAIAHFYVSPGGTSERIHLYYAEVNSKDKKSKGGGLKEEKEDIELVKISVDKVKEMLLRNEINDAKTIIALQHYYSAK